MSLGRSALLVCLFCSVAPTAAHAQDITLRADETFAPLAERVAQGASRRLGRTVVVGVPLDGTALLPDPNVVRLALVDGRAELSIMGGSRSIYAARLAMADDDAASVRALVLSLASLVETAASDVAPPPAAIVDEPDRDPPLLGPTDGSALRDLADPFETVDYSARPLIDMRGRIGLSTERNLGLFGVGLTGGVCFGPYCVALDADVLTPEEDHTRRTEIVSYVFTTVGLGARFLPLEAGPLRGGVGLSLLLRTGHLWIESLNVAATTFAAGGRFSLEGAVMLANPLALVLSGGIDVAFNPTKFERATVTVFREDVVVLWVALGLRICPE